MRKKTSDENERNHRPSSSSSHPTFLKNVLSIFQPPRWWTFLLVNLPGDGIRMVKLAVHRHPELIALRYNSEKRTKSKGKWIVVMRVGPFKDKQKALRFKFYWNLKSRGLKSLITKGVFLTEKYHDVEKLRLWTISKPRHVIIKKMISDTKSRRKKSTVVL